MCLHTYAHPSQQRIPNMCLSAGRVDFYTAHTMAVAYPRKDPLGIFVKAFRRYGGGLEVERVG